MQYTNNNTDLPTLKADWPGNPVKDGVFQYNRDPFFPAWSKVAKMMTSRNPQGREKRKDKWSPPVASVTHWMEDRENDFVVWLGHACFVIQVGGVRYITDPVLHAMPMVPRLLSPPFRPTYLATIAYILPSHDHPDHLAKTTHQPLVHVNNVRKPHAPLALPRTLGHVQCQLA